MKNKIIVTTLILVFALVSQTTFAQALPPPVPPTPTGVPFGPIEFLIAGLGAYAVKKYRNEKK
ncbi:MAG: hypothetical protein ACI8ZX_000789 [Planctomycetota bacterium]|jgi:hypothetical protein